MEHMWTPLILLQLLLAAAAIAATTTTIPGCRLSCGGVDIPYPFGIGVGCFRKGFEIECVNNGPVLAGTSLRVVKLTLDPDESQVMLPIGWQCYNASDPVDSYDNWDYGETTMNKDGVYRISNRRNILVVVGCNTFGLTASKRTEDGSSNYAYAYYTGCMSFCNNSASAKDGLCDGVGCCRVNIPPGLTHNKFNFREYDHSAMMDYSPCDYAFLVDRNNYTFRRSDLKMDTKRTSPVWLDWAIRGNSSISTDIPSCKQAAKTGQYACVSAYSECVDSSNGPGYNCKCSNGYEGDAYMPNGCTNIDECADPAKYPCYGVCTDSQGSYQCKCPAGSRSHDPITERCTQQFPLAARIAVGAISGILVLAILSFTFILRKERLKREIYRKNGGPTLEAVRSIKIYKEKKLKRILDICNLIGQGGFGEVYRGDLDGVPVAIKKPIGAPLKKTEKKPIGDDNPQVNNQFPNEVHIQSEVIHRNIVRLIGCCLEVDTPMLVYEFISNGSLDDILHHAIKKQHLSLDVRLSILQESATGLNYMHSEINNKILHGDVKPANILLDDNFQPKISDFGISRLIANGKEHTKNIIGDMAYMDPVYLKYGRLTDRSDVYSFGLVILEVISRKRATNSEDNSLLNSFLDCRREGKKATELFDKEIATIGNLEILDKLEELAMDCLSPDADQRPSMKYVKRRLELLQESNMP